jgi:hypothetical protein
MIVVGVDYSMTCPAICFMNPEWPTTFDQAGVMYLSEKKGEQKEWNVGNALLVGKPIPDWSTDPERFTNIATQLLAPFIAAMENEPVKFYVEGYSMGSKGKVFNIAEHAGMLKYFLWLNKVPYELVPPTVVKKFATGKGNADKPKMYEAFKAQGGPELQSIMFPNRAGVSSPVSDIVDAYFIAKYGVEHVRGEK